MIAVPGVSCRVFLPRVYHYRYDCLWVIETCDKRLASMITPAAELSCQVVTIPDMIKSKHCRMGGKQLCEYVNVSDCYLIEFYLICTACQNICAVFASRKCLFWAGVTRQHERVEPDKYWKIVSFYPINTSHGSAVNILIFDKISEVMISQFSFPTIPDIPACGSGCWDLFAEKKAEMSETCEDIGQEVLENIINMNEMKKSIQVCTLQEDLNSISLYLILF